ncbi:MAG TPA: efflux RND transporter permease subunit [Terriglobales bacterium]|jgi:multidrug efflux pump subunit AcrB|nr:efflux RND transporter permease subunit [Terriglobales bacterium]
MSRFSIRNPYVIIVACLLITVVGFTSLVRMPVDLFPTINIPEVVVATFYNGMPPEEIETEITGRFERFFTLGSGIDHIESRSLPGASVIKIYFQPGTDPDSDVTMISNLAMADLRRLPSGTLPPVVMKFDASSLPVCLITLKGEGLNETQLRDLGQFVVRNQVATVPGASVPPPFGGRYRQIMVYVDPSKLQARQLSLMDVVPALNSSNLILPAGDTKIGPYDYNIYTNSQLSAVREIDDLPLKTVGQSTVMVKDVGEARDAAQIQTNIVRVDGERSVYLPILKQGGDTNTIAVVDGVKKVVSGLFDVPKNLVSKVVFDQSAFVKQAIESLLHEGGMGLFLTCLMVLLFLGSLRATVAVSLSIPLSALAAIIALYFGGSSINTMVLAGLALAFSRLIDNSVIVLENIFRHLELGEPPLVAAERGGQEVSMAVLAATLTTAVVFFPVLFLYGVGRYLFSALALAVVLSLFASYFVAMTVVPLFCARLITAYEADEGAPEFDEGHEHHAVSAQGRSWLTRFNIWFNAQFQRMLDSYDRLVRRAVVLPRVTTAAILGLFVLSLGLFPFLGVAFFPRSDAGQFEINLKAQSGTRVEITNKDVAQVEDVIRKVVDPADLKLVVSNIGVIPGFSSIYTSNSGPHTATVLVALHEHHKIGSYEYMDRVRRELRQQMPDISAYFQSGGLQDAVLNQGLPAPIDVQLSGQDMDAAYDAATQLAQQIRKIPGVGDAFIPQNLDYPALRLDIDREHASEMGLTQKEVVDNIITALTSNGMIAPSYWIDPKTGNDYMLTVQYHETAIHTLGDLKSIPIRAPSRPEAALLGAMGTVSRVESPTEVDHYQIQRVIDIYVTTKSEDLGKVANAIDRIIAKQKLPSDVRVDLRGMVQGMRASFRSFGFGLLLSIILLYLILVAQFRSFLDPVLILLAVPTGITGVLVTLFLSGTTLNVQSLMGVIMMVGIVVSNSILIVEFAHRLEERGMAVHDAIISSCRIRLRPILMTSLATIIGLVPLALKLGTGSEAYAPLARAIIGGLTVSVVLTVFLVPAAYLWAYHNAKTVPQEAPE